MQKLFLIAFLAASEINANASLVYASDFGWNANDATSGGRSPDTTCRFDYKTFTTSPSTYINFKYNNI